MKRNLKMIFIAVMFLIMIIPAAAEDTMQVRDNRTGNKMEVKEKPAGEEQGGCEGCEGHQDEEIVKMHPEKPMPIEMKKIMINKEDKLLLNKPDNFIKLALNYEQGFIGVLKHTIQFGQNGDKLDYVNEANQNNLYPFKRFTADININKRHILTLLYQPLDITTEAAIERDIELYSIPFDSGTPMTFRYSFSFYRLSYMYDLLPCPENELALGLSFQIRNAFISFSTKDGEQLLTNEDIGPVPIFKLRSRFGLTDKFWVGTEADGFYADGKYITGSTNDFVGAIYDVSLRSGYQINAFTNAYINARYIGGGARGLNESHEGPGDGYVDNWLHTFSLSLGLTVK